MACEDVAARAVCLEVSARKHCGSQERAHLCPRTCGSCVPKEYRIHVYANAAWEIAAPAIESLYRQPVDCKFDEVHVGCELSRAPFLFLPHRPNMISPLIRERLTKRQAAPAETADLFLYFQTPPEAPFRNWTEQDQHEMISMGASDKTTMGNDHKMSQRKACEEVIDKDGQGKLLKGLAHLNDLTAHRHVIMPSWHVDGCQNFRDASRPAALQPPPRLARLLVNLQVDGLLSHSRAPWSRTFHVPFLSHVRWSTALTERGFKYPWRPRTFLRKRVHLASFCGSTLGTPNARTIRQAVVRDCQRANSSCSFGTCDPGAVPQAGRPAPLKARMESIFCLEPPGFGETRRSAIDSLLLGCVPVFFMKDSTFDGYHPAHFAWWGRNASVLVDPTAYLRGEVNLFGRLQAIADNPTALQAMRTAIGRNAHRLMYSIDRVPGDAIETLLQVLQRRLRATWHKGHNWEPAAEELWTQS